MSEILTDIYFAFWHSFVKWKLGQGSDSPTLGYGDYDKNITEIGLANDV